MQARRMPHRRTPLPPSAAHEPFEELVERALAGLPAQIRRLLENVAVVIEDEPTLEQLRSSSTPKDESLYGLYEGTPATVYAADWAAMPNKISLFRLPLEEDFADPLELAREVRRTVIHELAHHAGLDDARLGTHGLD
jgi:predicted Zn-dependent protease with MMP-like domain